MNLSRILFLLFIPLAVTSAGYCQSTLRLMSYNILNFPSPEPVSRIDTLEKILNYYRPHLFMIQELKASDGLSAITDMMDDLGYGSFAQCTYVPQQSSPGDAFTQQQAIVYDLNVLRLKSQYEIITDVRDINEYVMYLNDPELESGADTVFLYVYVAHLKSSTGTVNVNQRLAMVNDWRDYVEENVPPSSNVILAGDFNVYNNTEPAFMALTEASSPLPLMDVFSSFGNWVGSGFAHKEILTQSTRVNQLFGDGAGGGLDDRFDFMLFSESLLSGQQGLQYVENSFLSLGNNGTCYNQNLIDCDLGNDVPSDIIQALYYMSDHIPQVCELSMEIELQVTTHARSSFNLSVSGDPFHTEYCLHSSKGAVELSLTDLSGREITHWTLQSSAQMTCGNLPRVAAEGIYILRAANKDGLHNVKRVVLGRQ